MTALVRHAHYRIEPGGGPHGYLHNLRAALAAHPAAAPRLEVATLDASGTPSPGPRESLRALVTSTPGLRGLRHRLRGEFALRFERAEADWRASYEALSRADAERLLACDLFFAHETFLAERLLVLAPRLARERVALMTHAPSFYAHQIAGDLCPDDDEAAWRDAPCVRRLRDREVETMLAVKAVVWPTPGAADGYREWHERAAVAPPLVATGVPRPEPRTAVAEMRARWGVEAGQRVALFLGRPHPQKGFDLFVDWAEAARGDRSWVFVQAGGAPRHSRRELSRVRQAGYETDNGGAYRAADLVVFPNRYAYLDIGLLECLSLGAAVAVAPVGGHADVLRQSAELLPISGGAEAWAGLSAAAGELAEPARRTRIEALWAERYSPETFAAGHRAAAEALLA